MMPVLSGASELLTVRGTGGPPLVSAFLFSEGDVAATGGGGEGMSGFLTAVLEDSVLAVSVLSRNRENSTC